MTNILKHTITVITGTRAEYGLLKPLLFRIKNSEYVNLQLIVTGSHLSNKFGNTIKEIVDDGFSDYIALPIPIDDDSKSGMAIATGNAIIEFSKLYNKIKPELIVVLGDRYEILSAVTSAHLMGIPVAHIAGGDVTEGAVDDAIRHSITKMSLIHFPGCELAKKRIIQMGENPLRVYNVGELGVENCLNTSLMSLEELSASINYDLTDNYYSIVTFHPVTMENNTAKEQVCELIKAMNNFQMKYIITMANSDAGGREINNIWNLEKEKHSNWYVTESLGSLRYLSAVRNAKLVIGNSSSGLVEAPALSTPTINIGDRQKGRLMPDSVISCTPIADNIIKAMNKGLSSNFQKLANNVPSPYGNGNTSKQIFDILCDYINENKLNTQKGFYDL